MESQRVGHDWVTHTDTIQILVHFESFNLFFFGIHDDLGWDHTTYMVLYPNFSFNIVSWDIPVSLNVPWKHALSGYLLVQLLDVPQLK